MPRTGAPKGNQYAKKEQPGRTIGLYIASEDLAILEEALRKQGKMADKLDIDRYARHIFKEAVKRLERE